MHLPPELDDSDDDIQLPAAKKQRMQQAATQRKVQPAAARKAGKRGAGKQAVSATETCAARKTRKGAAVTSARTRL